MSKGVDCLRWVGSLNFVVDKNKRWPSAAGCFLHVVIFTVL